MSISGLIDGEDVLTSAVSTDLVDPEDGDVEELESRVLGRHCCKCLSWQRSRF